MSRPGMLDVPGLRDLVSNGDIDAVLVAFTDMQGRLQGKRCSAEFFLDEVLAVGTEVCSYTLATDIEMNTVPGYAASSWDTGYGDFAVRPDLTTLRRVPWQDRTAIVQADLEWGAGAPVDFAPRQVLRRQLERLTARGWTSLVGTELEFMVFRDTFEGAWKSDYRGLTPANLYNVDYSLLGVSRADPLLADIVTNMAGAGMYVESTKGECNLGQHEIAFRYADALTTCDNHVLYKHGAKEIAAQRGMSITFMAKLDEREGNSCHIHLSLRDRDDRSVFSVDPGTALSPVMEHFLAGLLAGFEELSLLFAPNINSYKRFATASFAPTAITWGRDNRTCAVRVVGHGQSLRLENRVPGGDVNPYLAVAAMLAAGLYGVDNELALEPECKGSAYTSASRSMPGTLRAAAERFGASKLAHEALGGAVVEHYLTMASVELAAFDTAVTDWERRRSFERG